MSYRSPLGSARGLGSAKSGVGHWWAQRLTAIALVPLSIWFVFGLVCNASGSYAEVSAWVATPWVAITLIVYLLSLFYHSALGMQVVIEDYVHGEGMKLASLILMKFAHIALAAAAVFAVLLVAISAR